MQHLDHLEYTSNMDDASLAIVGVTKTVRSLPSSRTGPGVYISYATRTWVSKGRSRPIPSQQTPSTRSRISSLVAGTTLSLLLLLVLSFVYHRYDEMTCWFQENTWQPWTKYGLETIQQQVDSAMAMWNMQVGKIQHLIKVYTEDDQLLYDRMVARMDEWITKIHSEYQPRQWMDALVTRAAQLGDHVWPWFWKLGQVIQEQLIAWVHGDPSTSLHQDDIEEIIEIDLNDEIVL